MLWLPAAHAAESDEIVAVFSSVSPVYKRTPLPGGSFKPETYAFGEGGSQGGAIRDSTIDPLRFMDIARLIAPALASERYLPCQRTDPGRTDLLIMVYWGTTIGTDNTSGGAEYQIAQSLMPPPRPQRPEVRIDPNTMMSAGDAEFGRMKAESNTALLEKIEMDAALQQSLTMTAMANRQRDRQNFANAAILGFAPEMTRFADYPPTAFGAQRQGILEEVEESRYYVVLMAYDFQEILHHKQKKLLWETRFSIRQRRNDFSRQLAAMAGSASRYFGQDSGGMRHKPVAEGHVKLGELQILGEVPERK